MGQVQLKGQRLDIDDGKIRGYGYRVDPLVTFLLDDKDDDDDD